MKAVFLALALAAAAPGAKVELKPLKRVTPLPVGRCDVKVTFQLIVSDGGSEDHYCPTVVWEWEDGTRSLEQSDCVPFAQAPPEDHRRTWTRTRIFQQPGSFVIRAHLCQASRRIQTVETRATVSGWDGYPESQRQGFGCSAAHASSGEAESDSLGETRPIDGDQMQSTRPKQRKDPCTE